MIGSYEVHLELTGTAPGGVVQATVPVSSGTLSMDRGWTPAVRAAFVVPYSAFDLPAWQLIEPTLEAQFCRLVIVDNVAGRQASWALNLRGYRHDVKAGTVDISAASYEALVQDYGRSQFSANFTDTAAWPSTLSIVQRLCRVGAGADAAPDTDWTAGSTAGPGSSNELRFMVPGTAPWNHIQAIAAHTPGGIVQHYGYGNNLGTSMRWLLTQPNYQITPAYARTVPAAPDPSQTLSEGSAQLYAWQSERSRDADEWGDAMYLEYPDKQHAASYTFDTSGYVMEYNYSFRGLAGSTAARRRQAQATSGTFSTPDLSTDRDMVAAQRLSRARLRAVGQTWTEALDVRLLPWQVHPDENSVNYMIGTITHNLRDGTSVVSANRL